MKRHNSAIAGLIRKDRKDRRDIITLTKHVSQATDFSHRKDVNSATWTWEQFEKASPWVYNTFMARMDEFRRYIEAASSLGEITRSKAEALVKELAASGEIERTHTKEWVNTLVKESKKRSDFVVDQIRKEINRQISDLKIQTTEEAVRRVLKIVTDDSKLSSLRDIGKRAINDVMGATIAGSSRIGREKGETQGGSNTNETREDSSAPVSKPPAKKSTTKAKTSGSAVANTSGATRSPAKTSTRSSTKAPTKSSTKASTAKSAARNSRSATTTRSSSSTTRTSPKQ